jgi:hypothetical protein
MIKPRYIKSLTFLLLCDMAPWDRQQLYRDRYMYIYVYGGPEGPGERVKSKATPWFSGFVCVCLFVVVVFFGPSLTQEISMGKGTAMIRGTEKYTLVAECIKREEQKIKKNNSSKL